MFLLIKQSFKKLKIWKKKPKPTHYVPLAMPQKAPFSILLFAASYVLHLLPDFYIPFQENVQK